MKRTSLTTAVIAGLAGVAGISNMASAVYLNQDGLGQVLIYPYYTVNAGNNTNVTVVNTTASGKAVKVRFLEAYDSREVLDFNLYLSPHDLWVAQVVPLANGGAGVWTNDNSCTVPTLPKTLAGAYAFSPVAYDGSNPGFATNDGGPKSIARTREGYVELIEMGTVVNDEEDTLAAITHTDGVPASCNQVYKAWLPSGYWGGGDATTDIGSPSGGLFGDGIIANVSLGTVQAYNADAIDQFYLANGIPAHSIPTSLQPSIATGTSFTSYVFAPSPVSTTPTLLTTPYKFSVDAVSSLFMADAIYNEYWTAGGTAANSEWVVTFPTKRFYVDPSLAANPGTTGASSTRIKPFDVKFSSAYGGTSCAPVVVNAYDREELTAGGDIGFSPSPTFGNSLCYEAQVVTFNQSGVTGPGTGGAASAVLGSTMATNIATPGENGWAVIDLFNGNSANHILPTDPNYTITNNVFEGLPVTGFWSAQLINSNVVNGVLANYTALYRHKSHRTCSNNGQACS